jgi:predicted secreted hydrolase
MIHEYGYEDEGSHPDNGHEWWQESVFLHWYDRDRGIGGVHRVGQEQNRDGGRAALQCGVFTDKGRRFRRDDYQLPYVAPTSPRGFLSGGTSWTVDSGKPRLEVHEPGLDLELEISNFYPPIGFFPDNGSLVEDFAKNHYESSGRVTGTVVLDGERFSVDGLSHRDHSWGTRLPSTLLTHRWVSGTFGPHLSFGSIVWHAMDGSYVKTGYVVRDGEVTMARDVDVVVWLESDGLTARGGEITWSLDDGSELHLVARRLDGYVCHKHNVFYVDTHCEVEHEGQIGYLDMEISNNARQGTADVTFALGANITDGLSTR